ncbi:hypothetical protein CTAYLR_007395 [Chrysophaeum taylorii]|uniref:BUB1 N-terminal domain-containing protein n=1 Tax=Chrysophaeum taylorii TaxID=2483200 RepID=A0AAD7U6L7_9STRA|nr:hypothetical protein CTAYLR_007395 [Chrysophaeum taylorii]
MVGVLDRAEVSRFEALVASASTIEPWLEYVRFCEEAFPRDSGKAVDIRERCARAFKDADAYRDDPRYVAVWLDYVDALVEPDEAFRFMRQRKIGDQVAAFWIAWALAAEAQGKRKLAADVYAKGIAKQAEPLDILQKRRADFEVRLAARDIAAPQEPAPRQPLANVGRARRPRQQPTAPPPRETGASSSAISVFVDDDLRAALPEDPGNADDWPDFGTRMGRAKENAQLPSRWPEAAIGRRVATLLPKTQQRFDIFQDFDNNNEPAAAAPFLSS